MKHLRPFTLREVYYDDIEREIKRIFDKTIFDPLRVALAELGFEVQNARPIGLEAALARGEVWYFDGRIYGRFNASISKELQGMGATFDKRTKSWKLDRALPPRYQLLVADLDIKHQRAMNAVISVLDKIDVKSVQSYREELQEYYGSSAWRMNEDFLDAAKSVTVVPEFTKEQRKIIAQDYSQNLELYIQDWCEESILDLRKDVYTNTLDGHRSGNLVKMIEKQYDVSREKAKFLARQETSLLMSKMRETRYAEIGIETYTWRGSMDEREREDHKLLEGKVFSFKNPPITNRKTGARNNPGEDFGPCRCLAIGMLPS